MWTEKEMRRETRHYGEEGIFPGHPALQASRRAMNFTKHRVRVRTL